MNNIHIQILTDLKNDLDLHFQKALGDRFEFDQDEMYRTVFENYRKVNDLPYGLRLTAFGNSLLSKHYKFYKYKNEEKIQNKTYVVLDKSMKWPYYLGRQIIVFYNEEDAAWFRLNGQNLNSYIDFM